MTKKKPAADLVLEELLGGIDSGDYLPGERINAAMISKKMGLSLAPVREALHILAGQGVVELLPRRGAILRKMTPKDVRDFWDIAAVVGRLGIELATPKLADEEQADRVRRKMDSIREKLKVATGPQFYQVTNGLHYLLNDIADNRFLHEITDRYMILYWEIFLVKEIPYDRYRADYIRNYQRIVDAVLCGDIQGAVAAWNYHVRWSLALANGVTEPAPGQHWLVQ